MTSNWAKMHFTLKLISGMVKATFNAYLCEKKNPNQQFVGTIQMEKVPYL